jgi:photosystem II stability/assembly factor-like uncharacterized protein
MHKALALLVLVLVFLSTTQGASRTATGLTNTYVYSLAFSGTDLFAGVDGRVFRSTNHGASWTEAKAGLPSRSVQALAVSGSNLFAVTFGGGVFRSTNYGASWTAVALSRSRTFLPRRPGDDGLPCG